MAQTRSGALRTVAINKQRNPNHYQEIGMRGGLSQTNKTRWRGFGSSRAKAIAAGMIGGKRGKRGANKFKPSTVCRAEMRLLMESWTHDEIIANWRRYDSKD